ncbi:MAG: hypothetical protein ACK5RI_12885, partial [Bacteroidota bacterium]
DIFHYLYRFKVVHKLDIPDAVRVNQSTYLLDIYLHVSPHSNIDNHHNENRELPIPDTLYYLNFYIKLSEGHP